MIYHKYHLFPCTRWCSGALSHWFFGRIISHDMELPIVSIHEDSSVLRHKTPRMYIFDKGAAQNYVWTTGWTGNGGTVTLRRVVWNDSNLLDLCHPSPCLLLVLLSVAQVCSMQIWSHIDHLPSSKETAYTASFSERKCSSTAGSKKNTAAMFGQAICIVLLVMTDYDWWLAVLSPLLGEWTTHVYWGQLRGS